jgi:hypothetical protein
MIFGSIAITTNLTITNIKSRASLHPRPKETGFYGQIDKSNVF